MSVTQQNTVFSYVASGGTTYAYGCRILDASDLLVTVNGMAQTLGVAYTVSGVGSATGGSVVFAPAPAVGATVKLGRATRLQRLTDYQIGGDFQAPTVNADLDRTYMVLMDLLAGSLELLNTLRVPAGESLTVLPASATRAGYLLGFDSFGQPVAVIPGPSGTATTLALDLINAVLAAKGAGQVGFGAGLTYPVNSVGAAIAALIAAPSAIPTRAYGVQILSSGLYDAFGDSFTAGQAASASTCYAAIVGARLNMTLGNRGVSGSGVTKALTQAWAFLPKYKSRGRTISWMAGFNDLYYNSGGPLTLKKLRECARAFMANAFLKTAVPASDGSVTRTGAWASATPGAFGDKSQSLGGTVQFSGSSSDRISWGFTGDTVVVGTYSNGVGTTYTIAPFDVYIDGTLVETRSPGGTTDGNVGVPDYYYGLTHNALVYFALGSGAHTIELRATSGLFFVDYFGTLSAPGECPSLLMADVAYVDAVGYATVETSRSQAIDNSASAAIAAEVAIFVAQGFPVSRVPVNGAGFYDTTTGISSDHVHPSPLGHKQIAAAFISRAAPTPSLGVTSCSLTKNALQVIPNSVATGVIWDIPLDDTQGFYVNATPTRIYAPTNGTLRIAGTITLDPNATGNRLISVYKNGSGSILRDLESRPGFAVNYNAISFSSDFPAVAGDYFVVAVAQNSGGNLNLLAQSQLDVAMVR